MKELRVLERRGGHERHDRVMERHDVTHRREPEVERLRAVLELAYPDRDTFQIEIGSPQ
jgi:hypothetical protein